MVAVDRASDDPRLPYPMGTAAQLEAVVASARAASLRAGAAGADDRPRGGGRGGRHHRSRRDWPGPWPWPRSGSADSTPWWRWPGSSPAGCPLWEMPGDQLGAVLGVDLGGPITAARVGIPAMLRRPVPRQGRFLAVASAAATRGLPLLAAYGAAKAGVAGLVRGLAVDLAGTGITANAVSPGSTATAMLDESARLYGLDDTRPFADQQSVGRLLAPEEVAAALVWLAGADSSALTGAVIPVDGGLSL